MDVIPLIVSDFSWTKNIGICKKILRRVVKNADKVSIKEIGMALTYMARSNRLSMDDDIDQYLIYKKHVSIMLKKLANYGVQ